MTMSVLAGLMLKGSAIGELLRQPAPYFEETSQ